ncbi:hypothetical protein LMA04_02090 [Pseudescherichia vulneris]|uniref:hypothetical protein n=1 Tax=Pseudescherichia vulneris TaxID=566 RepID=UPI00227C284E|nr:hypothetical protein [Pseudescherichia vulneris]WAH52870.1 hypothetical protein LMA04_02090 [Pseudescherichia vulneris]
MGQQYLLYSQIADALSFPNGERFDLLSHAGKIIRRKRAAGEVRPRIEGEIPMPQGGNNGFIDEYFYFYEPHAAPKEVE